MKQLITLLLASSLVGCGHGGPGPGGHGEVLPDYYATYNGADLGCCIVRDIFHKTPQALLKGSSKVSETPVWTAKDGALQMVLTAPPPDQVPMNATGESLVTPSMGIFSIGHDYGPGTWFTVSATFQRPVGTASGKAWSVGVAGRTGDVDDKSDLRRIVLSFRICTTGVGGCKDSKANLRVMEINSADPDDPADANLASENISDAIYNEIFSMAQPFTLKLHVNRKTGSGVATMTTGTETIPPLAFNPTIFKADSGEPITTLGATLADGFGLGESVSVEVTDFKIWGPPSSRGPRTTRYIRRPIPRPDPSRKPISGQ